MTLPLFDIGPPTAGWIRRSPPGNKLIALWVNAKTEWQVRHCGHPTANYPYFLVTPEGLGPTMTHNGRGFCTLARARQAADDVAAGRATVQDGRVFYPHHTTEER